MTGAAIDWDIVQLVVFDVDGTLYDQKAMRLRMFGEGLTNALFEGSLISVRVLRSYRRLREIVGDEESDDFDSVLIARTAEKTGVDGETVRTIVTEWMERRPLAHIRACRYPHLDELFAALKRHGKIIGIFSDYPATEKLVAMNLSADHVVAAGDVGILKPHPRGLGMLMERAGVDRDHTVLIGDRPERDGEAARRAGVTPLIRSDKPLDGWPVFSSYSDPIFAPLLAPRADRA